MLPIIFCAASLPIVILQIGLILGMPWGKLAMGGKFGEVFPPRLRVSAGIQLFIILTSLVVVLMRSDMIMANYAEFSRSAIWWVVALYLVSSVLNLITSSKQERLLGAPCVILMFISSLLLALN